MSEFGKILPRIFLSLQEVVNIKIAYLVLLSGESVTQPRFDFSEGESDNLATSQIFSWRNPEDISEVVSCMECKQSWLH